MAPRKSLNRSPRHNYIEDNGGLPAFMVDIASSIEEKRGIPLKLAIPIAIGVCRNWAEGKGNVTPKTRAKAAAAVAEYEALLARTHAKTAAKKLAKKAK